jgi:diguanylate cyclase (GGDEF)-like protein
MLTFRTAFTATVLAVVALPATAAASTTADPATVRDLAESGIEAVTEEISLLGEIGDLPAPPPAELGERLRAADSQGHTVLELLDQLDVDVTEATRAALELLPRQGTGFPPPKAVYDAAINDLARVAATPEAVLPDQGGNGPALGLLAVAAISLLVLGAAALGNTLRRRDSDDQLTAMAWSDGLTGLANRRRLDHDIATHDDGRVPVSVIMIDVDHFKTVNDTFGHQEGDNVLRRVGNMISDHVRFDDVVYRYGGEEFCVLLPGAADEDAVRVAERIVEAARNITLPDGSNLTVSVGLSRDRGQTVTESCESADRALLAAKSGGRDQYVDAGELTVA